MNLLLYSKHFNPRLKYICHQVIHLWMGITVEWTNDQEKYKNYLEAKINYSTSKILEKECFIPQSDFLETSSIKNSTFAPIWYNKIPALFPMSLVGATYPFDLLATLFFHLSRYEEYLPFSEDAHGRFPAAQSWAYRNHCLHLPIVNLLVELLKKDLQKRFPDLVFKKQIFQFLPTYDVDMAWAFSHKGWKRNMGGYFKELLNGKFIALKNRIKTHLQLQKDPFQTFELLDNWTQHYQLKPIYFFLLGEYGLFDKNNLISAKPFKNLIHITAQKHLTGIHPSYQSTDNQSIIIKEKNTLASVTQQNIHRSRQHYLKLHLPATYRQLIKAGITEDYSMGYATEIGFRASTALPFYWYDLEKEQSTKLLIYPFQVMDVTLKQYLKLPPEAATESINELIATTRSVNGIFCSLWHNSSFSELEGWKEWKKVYWKLLEEISN